MAVYCPYGPRERTAMPERKFWWIVKLCRFLLKCCGDGKFDETWEKRVDRKDGKTEYEFYIKVILNPPTMRR